MSKSKILWIITGTLAGALVAVSGYLFLGREEIDPNVTQMPAQVGENKFEEQVVKNDITKPREVSLDLISPNGGESFDISKSITIRYKLSDSFKKQLSPLDKVELYLVDSKNVLIGYIGEVNKTAGEFNWNTQKLFRNGGLDFSVKQTPAGQYRILLVVRKERDASDMVAKDTGISTIDGFIYSNGKIIQPGTNEVWREQPIASDISTSVFTFVNNLNTTVNRVNIGGIASFDLPNTFKEEYRYDSTQGFTWCDGEYRFVKDTDPRGDGSDKKVCSGHEYSFQTFFNKSNARELYKTANQVAISSPNKRQILNRNGKEVYLELIVNEMGEGLVAAHVRYRVLISDSEFFQIDFAILKGQSFDLFDQIRTNTLPKNSPYYTVLNSLTFTPNK